MSQIESFPPSQASASQLAPTQPKKPKPKRTNFTVSKVAQPIPLSCWSNAPYKELKWSHRVEAGMCATFKDSGGRAVLEVIKGSELIRQIVLSDLTGEAKVLSKLIFSKVSIMIRYPFPVIQDFHQPFTMHRIQLTLPPAQVKALLSLISPFFPAAADETNNPKQKQPKIAPALHPSHHHHPQGPHPHLPHPNRMPGTETVATGAFGHSTAPPALCVPSYRPLVPALLRPSSERPSETPLPASNPPWRLEAAWIQPETLQPKEDPAVARSIILTPPETTSAAIPPVAPQTPKRHEQPLINFDTPEAAASAVRYLPLAPDNVDNESHVKHVQLPSHDDPVMVAVESTSALFALGNADIRKLMMQTIMEPGFVPFLCRMEGVIQESSRTEER